MNVATGWPRPYGPSALTCTTPVPGGRVSTTLAFPEESVVTIRLESVADTESVVKNTLAPDAVPPDDPGARVAVSVNVPPV